jgi:hypothetical protein
MATQLALQVLDEHPLVTRTQILESLASLRQDWEKAANGESLLHIEGSVGLILHDFAANLNLTVEERQLLLGASLSEEVSAFFEMQM